LLKRQGASVSASSITAKALGRAVRELRIERGFSQETLADAAALHVTYLSGIERGLRNPTLDKLNALAAALEVRTLELLTRADAIVDDVRG
jgi:transcriptional regulator with XRE-family HTH domain